MFKSSPQFYFRLVRECFFSSDLFFWHPRAPKTKQHTTSIYWLVASEEKSPGQLLTAHLGNHLMRTTRNRNEPPSLFYFCLCHSKQYCLVRWRADEWTGGLPFSSFVRLFHRFRRGYVTRAERRADQSPGSPATTILDKWTSLTYLGHSTLIVRPFQSHNLRTHNPCAHTLTHTTHTGTHLLFSLCSETC